MLASLVATCKRRDVDPVVYLKDVLTRIAETCVLPAGVRNRRENGPGYAGGDASKCCRSSRSS